MRSRARWRRFRHGDVRDSGYMPKLRQQTYSTAAIQVAAIVAPHGAQRAFRIADLGRACRRLASSRLDAGESGRGCFHNSRRGFRVWGIRNLDVSSLPSTPITQQQEFPPHEMRRLQSSLGAHGPKAGAWQRPSLGSPPDCMLRADNAVPVPWAGSRRSRGRLVYGMHPFISHVRLVER